MKNSQTRDYKNVLLLSGVVVVVMFIISSYAWTQIPAGTEICVHWNAAGVCDDYGSKFTGLYLMPIVAALVTGLLTLVPRIEPRASHIAQSRKAYTAVWSVILLFFLAFHIVLMLNILGYDVNVGSFAPILVGFMFVVIGNYMGKVRSNFMFGIRTPWTLSSELSWNKTHRLGGRLFVLLGLGFIASAIIFTGEVWVYILLGGVFTMLFILMAYSYIVWRSDPDAHAL